MSLKGKEVLVIDDVADVRLLTRKILEHQGLIVTETGSVQEAIEYVAKKTPHLVIVDLHMPQKSGFDFLEFRKSAPSLASVPVMVASGLRDRKSIDLAIAMGANDYIIKPFSASILLQKARKSLRDRNFVSYLVPENLNLSVTATIGAEISQITATEFLIETPIRLSGKEKIKVSSSAFEATGTEKPIFVTDDAAGIRAMTGNYVSRVRVLGVSKSLSRKIRGGS